MRLLLMLALVALALALWSAWHAMADHEGERIAFQCSAGMCLATQEDVEKLRAYLLQLEKKLLKDCFLRQVGR